MNLCTHWLVYMAVTGGAPASAQAADFTDAAQVISAAPRQTQRCRWIDPCRQEVSGYDVVYRYNGRDITATLPYHPGNTVTVGVGMVGAAR